MPTSQHRRRRRMPKPNLTRPKPNPMPGQAAGVVMRRGSWPPFRRPSPPRRPAPEPIADSDSSCRHQHPHLCRWWPPAPPNRHHCCSRQLRPTVVQMLDQSVREKASPRQPPPQLHLQLVLPRPERSGRRATVQGPLRAPPGPFRRRPERGLAACPSRLCRACGLMHRQPELEHQLQTCATLAGRGERQPAPVPARCAVTPRASSAQPPQQPRQQRSAPMVCRPLGAAAPPRPRPSRRKGARCPAVRKYQGNLPRSQRIPKQKRRPRRP
mmetsp:Transcript_84018/g.271594  ORF Transcript_84018/g.271594 Transcript_84018/m.271594 type:complete len:269 (-) Transcript_84018:413-1219(-)